MAERPGPAWLWGYADSDAVPESVRRWLAALIRVVAAFRRLDAGLLAAAIAFYAFVSLVPLALLAVVAASVLGGGVVEQAARDAVGGLVTAEGEAILERVADTEQGRGGAGLVGVAVLLWSGLRVFRGIDRAIGRVYGTRPGGLLAQVRKGSVVLGALAVGVVGTGLAGAFVDLLPLQAALEVVGLLVVWAGMTAAFLPLYVVFPGVDVGVREALPGAALAAGAFVVLGLAFGAYASVASNYALYGLLGAVLLFLTWLHLVSTAVVLGAVLNAVLSGDLGDDRGDDTQH
ncbi:MAG: YihY/virulence factor BrkB family protein [Halobacteriales archaeon]